jgi:heme/copper-type cytochrome/quinol oxidase subunit 1
MSLGGKKANRPALRRWLRLLIPVLAGAAVVVGTAAVVAPRQPIGWFAYAPLADETFISDQLVLMDTGARAGYLLIAVGLLTLAFWLGYGLGVRRKGSWSGKNR